MPAIYREYNDEELVALMAQGDEAAFTEIYDRYWKRIFVLAASRLDDLGQAEDLVQDLLGDLWRRRAELNLEGKLETYLTVAVKYKVINLLAFRKREREYKARKGIDLSLADYSTEQWLDFEELKGRLATLVMQLPERCRLTYQLGREQGLSHKDIAFHMNISPKAVEQNTSRAIQALRLGLKYIFSTLF
jgi:RNA polymerase sigma-70 factor (ECF subfamily)